MHGGVGQHDSNVCLSRPLPNIHLIYGALYLASQIYVYRRPLWVKVMFTSEKNTDGDNGGGDDDNESGKRSDSHQPSFTIGRH